MRAFTAHLRPFLAAIPLITYRGAAGGVPIVTGLLIAHWWGLEAMAAFTVANAMITVAMVVADWGTMRALPRNLVALPPPAAAELLGSSNAVRLLLVAAMLLGGAGVAAAGAIDRDILGFLAVLFVLCPLMIATTNALSERVVSGETHAIAAAVAAGLIVFAAGGVLVVRSGLGPRAFAAAYVAGKTVEALILVWGRRWTLSVHFHSLGSTAAALWPFSAQMILGVIYSRAAIFTVENMTSRVELGVFSVAAALQSALYLIPGSTAMLHFPEMTRSARSGDRRRLRQILARYVMVSVGGVLIGLVVLVLFGESMSNALKIPPAYRWFTVAFAAIAVLGIFSTMSGFLMQAQGRESLAARLSVVTLSLALVYQLAALSAVGLWGIIAAVAAAEITTILVFGAALRRRPPETP